MHFIGLQICLEYCHPKLIYDIALIMALIAIKGNSINYLNILSETP